MVWLASVEVNVQKALVLLRLGCVASGNLIR
jgi:hypothetical protein